MNTFAAAPPINSQNNLPIGTNISDIAKRLSLVLHKFQLTGRAGARPIVDDRSLVDAMELILTEAEFLKKQVREQTDRIIYLEQLATTDELTGIANRRGFELELNRTLARASRQNEEGVLVYVDLDDFKPVNDTYGHAAGDEVLCRAAAVLLENTRDMDTVGRLGGDEFAIVLVGTNRDDGLARAETLNRALNRSSITWQGHNIPIRASFGMQAYRAGDAAADLMTNADAAMYSIKEMKASSATGGRRANRQASPLVAQTAV